MQNEGNWIFLIRSDTVKTIQQRQMRRAGRLIMKRDGSSFFIFILHYCGGWIAYSSVQGTSE